MLLLCTRPISERYHMKAVLGLDLKCFCQAPTHFLHGAARLSRLPIRCLCPIKSSFILLFQSSAFFHLQRTQNTVDYSGDFFVTIE
jgi:hypothetical protein